MNTLEREWTPVTKRRPCPACGHPDWCAWTQKGWLKCERSADAPEGMTLVSQKDGGALFKPERASSDCHVPTRSSGTFDAFAIFGDLRDLQRECGKAASDVAVGSLARDLGVSAESLRAIGVGRLKSNWTFPEWNDRGEVIGLATRSPTGKKSFKRGGHRGLVLPAEMPARGGPVLLVEGPTDVAACLTLGLPAVGRPSCTGGTDFLARMRFPNGVTVVGENDLKSDGKWPGRDGAKRTAETLASAWGREVPWTLVPEGHKDVRDWLKAKLSEGLDLANASACARAGAKLLNLLALSANTAQPASGLVIRSLAEIEPREVQWLWEKRFPKGMLTLMCGDPGSGKSTICGCLAAAITTGGPLPGGCRAPKGRVLWLSAEDDTAAILVPKAMAAGADRSRFHIIEGVRGRSGECEPFNLQKDLEELEAALKFYGDVELLVIDPLTSYLGTADYTDHQKVRAVLGPLKVLCEKHGLTAIGVMHFNKSEGTNPLYRIVGSGAFGAAARSVWMACRNPEQQDESILVCAKMSVAPMPLGVSYTIAGTPPAIAWGKDDVTITAQDALAAQTKRANFSGCQAWLNERLLGGMVPLRRLLEEGERMGYAEEDLQKARKGIGARTKKISMSGGWGWYLPGREALAQEPEGCEEHEDGEGCEGGVAA
jgi:putative DNA primase/helicase